MWNECLMILYVVGDMKSIVNGVKWMLNEC